MAEACTPAPAPACSGTAAGAAAAAATLPSGSRPLDGAAIAWIVLLCAAWGLQQVAIKLALPSLAPLWQASLRAILSATLLALWCTLRGERLFKRDGTLPAGLLLGLIFTLEFVLVYQGIARTSAARAVMFFYTAPFFVAVGSHLWLPGERLGLRQAAGLLLAFAGVVAALGDGSGSGHATSLAGDLMIILGAAMWAATTLLVKLSPLAVASAGRVVFYQMMVAAVLTPLVALALGQAPPASLPLPALLSLLYQSAGVAFFTYIIWFRLITRYSAARLSSFTFLTPVFGMAAGALVLAEPVSPILLLALMLICGGIWLVNRRPAARARVSSSG